MAKDIISLFDAIRGVTDGRCYYGQATYDSIENPVLPYTVYFEVNKRATSFNDNHPTYYVSTYQISLITKKKDVKLEQKLETALLKKDFIFQVLSEYRNEDKTISRVYEIKMEEYINGK